MTAAPLVLAVPGYMNAGPEHWLSRWERAWPHVRRVEQDDWEWPDCAAWVRRLEAALNPTATPAGSREPVLVAAHSLGCLLVAHWCAATAHPNRVAGALLVAPPDLARPDSPAALESFAPAPLARLPFRTILVSSINDPWCTPAVAASLAEAWGSRLVNAGAVGHLDSSAGVGAWPTGWSLLASLMPAPAAALPPPGTSPRPREPREP